MAFPTATGFSQISNAATYSRPFLSSGGNVYIIGKRGTTALGAEKATDPTSSFSNVGTDVTLANTLFSVAAVQSGDNLHVVTTDGSATSINYRYHVFSMSSDSWTTSNETVSLALNPLIGLPAQANLEIGIRSDGDVILIYQGAKAAVMGTDYRRVKYARREGGVWTVNVSVDNAGALNWAVSGMVAGSSDRMHLFFIDEDTPNSYQRALTSANALESFPSAYATNLSGTIDTSFLHGASYDSSGTQKVRFPATDTTSTNMLGVKFDSADAPTVTEDSDITGTTAVQAAFQCSTMSADGTTLWHAFIENTSSDLYTQSNENDGGWSTPAAFTSGVGVARVVSNVYTRGSSTVLALVYLDGTTTYYNEMSLSVGTTDADFDMDAAATLTMSGRSTAASNLSAAAIASATFNGRSTAASNLDADAAASVTWTGAEVAGATETEFDMDAAATVTWGGTGLYPAAFDSDAAATVTFNGIATAASNLDSDALAVLTWAGASTATSNVDSDAAAVLTWNGAALAYADWTSTATADLQWVGEQLTIAASDWSSAATASLTWNGISTASSNLDADAAATLTWNGVSTAASNLSSDSAAVLTWNGIATAASSWSAAAVSSVTFNGTGLYPAALDADAAASLTWNGAEIAVTGSAWSAASTADVTWGGVTIASGYIDTDIDAFATLRMVGGSLRSADFDADATASVTWEGVAQAPDIEAAAFESAATATLTMTGESSVTATWNAVAAAALTMAGTEVTAAAWSAAAVATITFTGQEVGETGQFDIDAAASVSWGGADATPATGLSAIVRDGWRVKADMARELEELDEEDILAMLAAAVAYMEVA